MTTGPATDSLARPTGRPIDDELVARVNDALTRYLAARRPGLEVVHPALAEVTGALTDFVLGGGKRVRPTFAWWGWRGAGGAPDGPPAQAALTAVSALELVQANALVHDDLIDASATRRGSPTVHVAFGGRHRERGWLGPSDRFGTAAAVLIGDLALAWADDMFDEAFEDGALDGVSRRRARRAWAGMRTDVVGGQYLDTWSQATGDETPDAAMRVNRFKTAAYTVERPLQLGAALAGASPRLEGAYRRFGADLGIAFQLRDDLLGVFGDPEVTGKPAGDDLREGKRTLLVALALDTARQRADRGALNTLTAALGDPGLDEDRVHRVREVLRELGAPDELERRIERLTESALAALDAVELAAPADVRLPELAHAATRRRY